MIAFRCLFSVGTLVLGCLSAFADAGDGTAAVHSEYVQVLGAGGLRFDREVVFEAPDLQRGGVSSVGYVVEYSDLNNDGVDDMLMGFSQSAQTMVRYLLGEIQMDGSTEYLEYSFEITEQYDALACGDLDGNGWPDLITREYEQDSISIWWVEGGEIVGMTQEDFFFLEYDDSMPDGYHDARVSIRAADLDGDGIDDLVMNTWSEGIVVRWSSRNDATRYSMYFVPGLDDRNGLYPIADYDGDGDLDVLLLDVPDERFSLLSSTGADSLMVPTSFVLPVTGFVGALAYPIFGMFDVNPGVDLVIFDAMSSQSLLIPNFVVGLDGPVVLGIDPGSRVVEVPGDVDGSGFDDLLVVGDDPLSNAVGLVDEVSLLFDPLSLDAHELVIETGNVSDPDMLTLLGGPRVPICRAVRLDGDSDDELLWLADVNLYKFQDAVTGSYTIGHVFRVSEQRDAEGAFPRFGATQREGQKDPLHLLPMDVDADGVEELYMVGVNTRGRLVDFDAGTVENLTGVNNGFMSIVADLGGDGQDEIVVTRLVDGAGVVPVNGDGTFGTRVLISNPNGNPYNSGVPSDFDLDGLDDLVLYDQVAREFHVLLGTGNESVVLHDVLVPSRFGLVKPAVLDHNGDGYDDLVLGAATGLQVYLNNQDGTFTASDILQAFVDPYWMITADMDGDGIVDLVGANSDQGDMGSGISVHFMGIDGQVESTKYLSNLSVNSSNVAEVIAHDLNHDGLLDLVGIEDQTESDVMNHVTVWIQSSGREFEPSCVLPAPAGAAIHMSDLNLDGAMDVITASDMDDSVRVHWGDPMGCAADLTGEGDLNFLDISEFLSAQLDFNGDGSFNFLDISAYLQAFAAGCP